jgi:hypothetical protein
MAVGDGGRLEHFKLNRSLNAGRATLPRRHGEAAASPFPPPVVIRQTRRRQQRVKTGRKSERRIYPATYGRSLRRLAKPAFPAKDSGTLEIVELCLNKSKYFLC